MNLIQNRPRLLEKWYTATYRILRLFRRWLKRGGVLEKIFIRGEKVSKGIIFDCQMCGDCILHSTGMTCPMTCPKNLRNGPCGGVRSNGHCEIKPDMPCVWVMAWERSKKMKTYGDGIFSVQSALDHRLHGTSSWINEFDDK